MTMLVRFLIAVTDPTVPPTTAPVIGDDAGESNGSIGATGGGSGGVGSTLSNVVTSVFDNLGHNGYQTGVALVAATIAIVGMLNIGVHRAVIVPVGIGAFWAGWLGWNTFTGQSNPLFPGDVSATKLWDVAFTSDRGFLLVVAVACVAAVFLWRKGTDLFSRVMLIVGAVLGASFLFNLIEAFRVS